MMQRNDPVHSVEIINRGQVSSAVVPWRVGDDFRLTVVVKATFVMHPGADMVLAAPIPVLRSETHLDGNGARSPRTAREVAPHLRRADLVLVGSACAPAATPLQAITVRFALVRDRLLFEKRINVFGDRSGGELLPFDRMPLVYERAVGGAGHPENPYGTGYCERDAPPNLFDPTDPGRVACFAPLATNVPSRQRLISTAQEEGLNNPVITIRGDFDWSYFQAAPPDQRLDYLLGDEWVVIDGMHPVHRSVQSRLPDANAVVELQTPSGATRRVALVCDTLYVDADNLRCWLLWRASFPLHDEAALGQIRIRVGISTADEPLQLEDPASPVSPPAAAPPPPSPTPQVHASPAVPMAFRPGPLLRPSERSPSPSLSSPSSNPLERTIDLPPRPPLPRPDEVLPFHGGGISLVQPAASTSDPRAALPSEMPLDEETADLPPDLAVGAVPLPFPVHPETDPTPPPEPAGSAMPMAVPPPFLGPIGVLPSPAQESVTNPLLAHPPGPAGLTRAPAAGEVALDRFAIISVHLLDRRVPRADVLASFGLVESRWVEVSRRWSEAMSAEEQGHGTALRDEFDAAFVAEWEAQRGALEIRDYARLALAAEGGGLATALEALDIRRTVWTRVRRVWSRRLANDKYFAATVEGEMARQRRR